MINKALHFLLDEKAVNEQAQRLLDTMHLKIDIGYDSSKQQIDAIKSGVEAGAIGQPTCFCGAAIPGKKARPSG